MRYTHTSPTRVDNLKKQTKRLQRNGRGKYAKLLDRVSRTAGYA